MLRLVIAMIAVVVVSVGVILAMRPLLNIVPDSLKASIQVATGLGAKLACSGRYLTGLSSEQISDDLQTYSVAFGLVELSFDDSLKQARAELPRVGARTASYHPALGCTLDVPKGEQLGGIIAPANPVGNGDWPTGDVVNSIQAGAQQQLQALLAADNSEGYQTRALAIVRGGQIVAEVYAAGFDAATPHLGWSMGKSVTAILLGSLEQDGLLQASENGLLPRWNDDGRREISVQNLLQMTSGLEFNEDYSPGTDATYMLSAATSAAAVAREKALMHSPGSHFAYSSGSTNLLALLYHRRVGNSTQAALNYLHEKLMAPLAITSLVMEPDPSGVFVGSSYVYASARDWARLGQLMLSGGELAGHRVVSEEWVTRASSPNSSDNDPAYGYQFWLNRGGAQLRWPELPEDAYAMQGNRGQVVMIIPSRDTVIVRLGWSEDSYPRSAKFSPLL